MSALAAPPDEPDRQASRFRDRPRWRRPQRIGRQLAGVLVVTAALAVLTFGGLNYVAARDLLVRGTEGQLAGVGAGRAVAIESGAARLTAEVSSASSDLALANALEELAAAFEELDSQALDDDQRAELEESYQARAVDPLNEAGLGPYTVEELLPRTEAGRWLQYHYTLRPAGEPPPVDAGDGTTYSEVNATVTPYVEAFSQSQAGGDVLLIDEAGTVVYSLDKRNDVGTNLVSGPYAESSLARAVTVSLPRARVGTAVLTSYAVAPTGRAALFAVSAVTSGSQVVGALAVELPVEAINSAVSAGGEWDAIGVGAGDVYVVGSDQTLQSEPRAWQDDPAGYLERLKAGTQEEQDEARLIELFGSPVGIQVIDTEPVQVALSGEEFRGGSRNDAGESTYAASESFNVSGQQWVVVSEVPRSDVLAPLTAYLGRIALVLGIVLPIVAALGLWLARRLTRPIRPIAAAADAIAAGDRDPDVDTTARDEFGDLGRRLTSMASALAAHEQQLTDEYDTTRRLLLAVLPARLVDDDGRVTGTGEAAEAATVVALALAPAGGDDDPGSVGEALASAAGLVEDTATRLGLQRVRTAADRFLLVSGMGTERSGADAAVEFAAQMRTHLPEHSDVPLTVTIGLSTGVVATGVLDRGALTFGAWGEPVRRALALASLAATDDVLVHGTTAAECEQAWPFSPATDVVALDGQTMDLLRLDPADPSDTGHEARQASSA
jgi:HAMP domain-containing protein